MATLWALLAISLWGSLAPLTSQLGETPRFFLVGISLLIGSIWSLRDWRSLRSRIRPIFFAVFGIFGYHALLFFSFKLAPIVEANLINYLWPVFVVLFSGLLLPAHRLVFRHWVGMILGFAGVWILLSPKLVQSADHAITSTEISGYLFAFFAAVTWGIFSVGSKKMKSFTPRDLGLGCLISGILSLSIHFSVEPGVALEFSQWILIFFLGIGPMGIAFFAWDKALKLGDPRLIGTLSFLTPVLSTLGLAWVDSSTRLSTQLFLALAFILTGALFTRNRA